MANKSFNEILLSKKIAELVLNMHGVNSLAEPGITESITKTVLRKNNIAQGIKISVDDNKIIINLNIIVYYGINIPQLSYDIQSQVKSYLMNKTEFKSFEINVYVNGVVQSKE